MGMDYQYAGSASYPRFDREIKEIISLFGGQESIELQKRKATENDRLFGYCFGYMSSAPLNMEKYIFPKNVNPTLVKWFNNLYGDNITKEETAVVFNELNKYKDEIEKISDQLLYELECLVKNDESWYIY